MSKDVFKEGSHVVVLALKRVATVVASLGSGRYTVALGALTLKVAAHEISPIDKPTTTESGRSLLPRPRVSNRKNNVPHVIDLHGFIVEDAVRALEEWLNAAIIAGYAQLQVVHGLGSGRVQQAVHDVLGRYPVVRAFRINDRNPGATDIFIG